MQIDRKHYIFLIKFFFIMSKIDTDINEYINPENFKLLVIVKPNSPKTEVIGYDKNKKALRIALHAKPEQGKANIELIRFLKKRLKKEVKILNGFTSKQKLIRIVD